MSLQVFVGATTVSAWMSSFLIDFRPQTRPSIQPKSAAFSIWLLIFPLIIFNSFYAGTEKFPNEPSILIATSMATTILWALASRYKHFPLAFVLLVSISIQAWIAHVLLPSVDGALDVSIHLGTGLFAGWTGVASIISLAIAYKQFDDARTLFLVNMLGILSLCFQRPVPMVSVLWGLIFSETENIYIVSNIILSCIWLLSSFLWGGSF